MTAGRIIRTMRYPTAAPSLFFVQAFSPSSSTIRSHRSYSSILPSYSSIPRKRRTVVYATERSQNKKKNWWERMMGGGAYNLQIDYDTLEFPAPQLAQKALLGKPMSATTSICGDDYGSSEQSQSSPSRHLSVATFAGGCFWGVELAFQRIEGVAYTCVGYTQGRETRPNYEQVLAGNTGHTESVCVYFDPKDISYLELCQIFLHKILSDPTTVHGQGKDYGRQYRTGIYYHRNGSDDDNDEYQKVLADQALAQVASQWTRPIAVECRPAQPFWPAEAHHQRYLEKGGRYGTPQSAAKNCTDSIQCYG